MPVGGLDACFEILRVATLVEHLPVIVGLDDNVGGEAHIIVYPVADAAEVGRHGEADMAVLDEVAGIVGAVVHHLEGRKLEIADFERELLVDRGVVILDSARYVVAAEDSVKGLGGTVDAQVLVTS